MGLLDDLKKEADNLKDQESVRTQSLKANAASVDRALRKTFQYLNELFRQLNVVKPPCTRSYDLLTVGKISGFIQVDYRIDYRTSQRDNMEHYESLAVTFKRTKPEQLTVKRDAEQIERFRDLLWQNNLRFTSEPVRNDRRVVVSETFMKLRILSTNRSVSRPSCTNPLTTRTPWNVEANSPLICDHSR